MPAHPPTVYLHVGPPKTGTTFVQEMLWSHADIVGRQGVGLPGSKPGDHFRAALDLRGIDFGGYADPATEGAWPRLARQARAMRTPRVVISHEVFAGAGEEQIARLVEDLAPAELHLVYGARNIARQMPAVWQESLKNKRTASYAEFLDRTMRRSAGDRGFWRSQHPVRTLRRWASVPAGRIHVVTVPRPGAPRGCLWQRFCSVLGLDHDASEPQARRSNPSLDPATAEVLRRLNLALEGRDLGWPAYERLVKSRFNRLADGSRGPSRFVVPSRYRAQLEAIAGDIRDGLAQAGYQIVGDLADLMPVDDDFGDIAMPDADTLTDAAVAVLADALTEEPHPRRPTANKARVLTTSGAIRRARGLT